MGCTINLHCQTGGDAIEVQDVGAERMLTPELQAIQTGPTNTLPERDFSTAHGLPECLGADECFSRGLHAPRLTKWNKVATFESAREQTHQPLAP